MRVVFSSIIDQVAKNEGIEYITAEEVDVGVEKFCERTGFELYKVGPYGSPTYRREIDFI